MKILRFLSLGLIVMIPMTAANEPENTIEDELLTWVLYPCYRVSVSLRRARADGVTPRQDTARSNLLEHIAPAKRTAWTNTARSMAASMEGWSYDERRKFSAMQLKTCIEGLEDWLGAP